MKKLIIILLAFFSVSIWAQSNTKIEIPVFNDKYVDYVKKLENGNTEIDYRDFRNSFIESEQFKIARKNSNKIDSLKTEMYNEMKKEDFQKIITITKEILSIDYTNLYAQKILRQTYKIIGDEKNAEKYKTIQFGLLNSIINKKDGLSCENSWNVIQISEEHFVLEMIGAKLNSQSLDSTKGLCDKMEVETEDKEHKTYYFEVSKVFEGYKKLGIE